MNDELMAKLSRLFAALENSADDTGCSDDLTVVSKSALEALAEAFEAKSTAVDANSTQVEIDFEGN